MRSTARKRLINSRGAEFGEIPVSFFWTDAPAGTGPGLHRHQYPEIFVVQEGPVAFTVGTETITAAGDQIVIAPAGVPHMFVNQATGLSRHIDIHPVGRVNGSAVRSEQEIITPLVIRRSDLPRSETAARFEGRKFGGIPVSFFWTDAPPNSGPSVHRHPYAEVFLVQEGRVRFTAGQETVEAVAGQIVIAPGGVPHQFINLGPGRSRHLDIHPSAAMRTEWRANDEWRPETESEAL
jgi:quercetin dioxygenase-like cupin family protein